MADEEVLLSNDTHVAPQPSAYDAVANNNNTATMGKDVQFEMTGDDQSGTGVVENGGPSVSNGHSYEMDGNGIRESNTANINGLILDSPGEPDAAPCEAFKPESIPKDLPRVSSPQPVPPTSPTENSSPRRRSPSPRKGTPTRIPAPKPRPKSVGSYEDTAAAAAKTHTATSPRPNSCVIKSNTSRIDSRRDNHTPGGGNVKILDNKLDMSGVKSRTVSHTSHKPGGGNIKIFDQKLDYSHVKAKSDVGSGKTSPRRSTSSEPTSPRVKTAPAAPLPNTKNVQSKIGFKDNLKYTPGGGQVKVQTEKVDFSSVQSRCGSLDNSKHKPGGGNIKEHAGCDKGKVFYVIYITMVRYDRIQRTPSRIPVLVKTNGPKPESVRRPDAKLLRRPPLKILDQKVDFTCKVQSKVGSLEKASHTPSGGQVKIENKKLDFTKASSKVGSKDNIKHQPRGGNKKIVSEKVEFKAESKIGSKDNMKHQAGGGNVKIVNEKVDFGAKASSKIGSKDNIQHKPGGGKVQIKDEKLKFKESASPRTDTGVKDPRSPRSGSQSRLSRGSWESRSSVGSHEGVSDP